MIQKAIFGGGCFWCIEAMFKQLLGVSAVVSGYAGGHTDSPKYEEMHEGKNGHAEVVQVSFDPNIISYRELLEIFFTVHDPTTPNQQGHDIGPQYRSIILYENDDQARIAKNVIDNFATTLWDHPISTELKLLDNFWPAENYHQNYFENNPETGYCMMIINPKLQKFRQTFANRLKVSD